MNQTTTTTDVPNLREETDQKMVSRDPEELTFLPFEKRTHSDVEIDRFQQTILDFRGAQPIVIDAEGNVAAGRGRVEAAMLLGIEEIPALPLSALTADDLDHYTKTLGCFGQVVGWTRRMVQIDLQHLLVISAFLSAAREKKPRKADKTAMIRRLA